MNTSSPSHGGYVKQGSLTIITKIKPGAESVSRLEEVLDQIGGTKDRISNNGLINFQAIQSLHFCCWVVVRDDPDFPPCLVLESNHDGLADAHLGELIQHGRKALDAIYVHCEGFSPGTIKEYLLANSVPTAAFYVGCPGQTVGSVNNAIQVRLAIQDFLDRKESELAGLSASQVHQRIKGYLASESPVKPVVSVRTLDQQNIRSWVNVGLIVLAAAAGICLLWRYVPHPIFWAALMLLLVALVVFVVILRGHEMADKKKFPSRKRGEVDPRLFTHEDVFTMNHLTTMVNVSPGAFRLSTLKVVLWLINKAAAIFFTTGSLGGIPTIHFARWILMENDRRLLFFSNYDGSWASYLGDFVDKASYGLTAVWSNTASFPPATGLVWGGALHIEDFKAWSREHNLYAGVWYTAYPEETLWNLQKDVRLRDTIGQELDEEQAKKLLQLL